MASSSPFLEPGFRTAPDTLAIALLSRGAFEAITLERSTGAVDGYAEGATLNTRFGSFPHSTLLDIPWGSQVRASVVDTGSRGRKRRREDTEENTPAVSQEEEEPSSTTTPAKKAVAAPSGFIHILRPTPELWTSSLPHRTQVVYTPDYSYILHRIRARPGTRIIEAGAGSGSFTHASVRAVYNGISRGPEDRKGHVFSFEFHEPRFRKMQEEVKGHSLDGLVQVTHRDVYKNGFLVGGNSPEATAVFLDLPAPWEALRHLARRRVPKGDQDETSDSEWVSPLDPKQTVHICSFSPCIEQVQRTVTELRTLGWTDVDMVEMSHKRLNVLRDRIGINLPNEKGHNQSPADVAEAVTKLRVINKKMKVFHHAQLANGGVDPLGSNMDIDASTPSLDKEVESSAATEEEEEKHWMQGRLVHRPEAEIKTHTSYLVFAVLPREWDEDAEAAALARWPCGNEGKMIGTLDKEARKVEKRETMFTKKKQRRKDDRNTQIQHMPS